MQIFVSRDEETSVWIAECEEIGLVLESESYDVLIERIHTAVPEQLRLNGHGQISSYRSVLTAYRLLTHNENSCQRHMEV